jgi:hypothetical protein
MWCLVAVVAVHLGSDSVSIIILKTIEPAGLNKNSVTFSEIFDCIKSDLIYLSEHFVIRLGTGNREQGTCYPKLFSIPKGLSW